MDRRRDQGGRHGRGHRRDDRHCHNRRGRSGEYRRGRSGEDRRGRSREDRRGRSRENREHEVENWEGQPQDGYAGGRFPDGMDQSSSRYATEPQPARHRVTSQDFATQPHPRHQQQRDYPRGGWDGYRNAGYEQEREDYPQQDERGYRDSRYRREQEDYPPQKQRGHRDSRYPEELEDYPSQRQRGIRESRYHEEYEDVSPQKHRGNRNSRYQDYPPMDHHGHHDSRHQPEQEDYPPMDHHGHHDSRHQPEQEDYPPMDQHGHHDSRHQPEQEDYPPMDQHGHHDSRHQPKQEDYPPMDQHGHHDSRHQPEQEDYPPMDQHGHHDSRHQPEQEDYPPMDQHGHHDSRHQPKQEDYPPMDQHGHHDSRHQPEQEDYPPMDQHGHHDSRHQPKQEDYPPMDQHGLHDSRHQPKQEDYPPVDQQGHHESRHPPEQEDYPHKHKNSYVDPHDQGDDPFKDQDGVSASGLSQKQKLDKEKHPILTRRIITEGGRPFNIMRVRIRQCVPEFDFDAFTDQMGEDELKKFQPQQHSLAGSVYQGEGEEETQERRLFAKELLGMMDDGEQGKGHARKKITNFDRMWKDTKTQMWEALQWFVVWRGSFKDIEAQHGSSTTSYFSVLRWLLFLNLFVAVIMAATIVMPQVFFDPDSFNVTHTAENDTQGSFMENAMMCSEQYQQEMNNRTEKLSDKIIAVIQGTGWMEKTVLFAGHYFNKTVVLNNLAVGALFDRSLAYNMPLAFLLTTAVYFIITLTLMVLYTGEGVTQHLLSSDEDTHVVFNKCFSGWDYSLMQEDAAPEKIKELRTDFERFLTQIYEKEKRDSVNIKLKYAARIFVNLVVLGAWGGSGYVIYMVITQWTDDLTNIDIVQRQNVLTMFVEFLPSATITALNIVVPTLFSTLVAIEYLSPDAVVEITVARSVVLRLASIVVLVVSLHARITKCRNDGMQLKEGCNNCKEIRCWETYVGIEFYKLVVMDFVITIIATAFEFIRKKLTDNMLDDDAMIKKIMKLKEFNLPNNVLAIVYAQTVCWIGAFFCPLIPAITVVKFFFYFYLKKMTLLKNFESSPRAFRASKTNSFFMAILLASLVMCASAMAFVIASVQPSKSCGPWRVYSKEEDYYMYVTVSDWVATAPRAVGDILAFLISWVFFVPMIILMGLVVFYNLAIASGQKTIIQMLKDDLKLEGKDKQFRIDELQKLVDPIGLKTRTKQRNNRKDKHKRGRQ